MARSAKSGCVQDQVKDKRKVNMRDVCGRVIMVGEYHDIGKTEIGTI